MAFPTTSLLDDFNRTNENPLSGGGTWTNQIRSGDTDFQVLTNHIEAQGFDPSQQVSAWRNNATFGPDCEAFITVSVLPAGSSRAAVLARLASPGTGSCDGYACLMRPTGATTQGIYRYDNDVPTLLGAGVTPTWTAGDKLGIEIVGSTIRMMQYTGGAWSQLASRTDGTYSAAGYIGADTGSETTNLDDFSGGTVSNGLSAIINQVTETELAQAITRQKFKTVGQNTETDIAQSVRPARRYAVAQITETNTAQSVARIKRAAVSQINETDLAQAVTRHKIVTIGQASETDEAQSVTASKLLTVGIVAETDTAQGVTVRKVLAVGQVSESDEAQVVARRKIVTIGQTSETDEAQPVSSSTSKVALIGQVSESDEAQSVTRRKVLQIAQVSEGDSALAVALFKNVTIGQVTESDAAQPVSGRKVRTIGQAAESDQAQAVNRLVDEFFGLAYLSTSLVDSTTVSDGSIWTATAADAARESATLEDEPL